MAVVRTKWKAMALREKLNIIHKVEANMNNEFTVLLMTELYLFYKTLFPTILYCCRPTNRCHNPLFYFVCMLRALPSNGRCLQNHCLAMGLYTTLLPP
jgi:hypothetical protein